MSRGPRTRSFIGGSRMKEALIMGIIFFMMGAMNNVESTNDCILSSASLEHISQYNLATPTTEWGCKMLNSKFEISNKECWVTRERDNKVFKGVMGHLRDGSIVCFSPSKKKVVPVVIIPEPVCTKNCINVNVTEQPVFCIKSCTEWHRLRCVGTWEWNYDYCSNIGLTCKEGFVLTCSRYSTRFPRLCLDYDCNKTEQSCTTTCSG